MADLYAQSGVNIDAGNESVKRFKSDVASTHTSAVLTGIGSFGGLYSLKEIIANYKDPVLVQSIDGVGTKLSVARMMGKYDTVGEDIVNHCADDLLAMGARSLTFLDYVAHDVLDPKVMGDMVSGMAKACREGGISLIGGETAEMPGVYQKGEHDIAGCVTGVVEREKIITGEKIKEGDILLGLASTGLHTNGYSLARKILFEICGYDVSTIVPELSMSVGDSLLEVHKNYAPVVLPLLDGGLAINGIAHITGGGFIENIPRVLPKNLDAEIAKGSWPVLPLFSHLVEKGNVSEGEAYRVFNMGIGLVLVVSQDDAKTVFEKIKSDSRYQVYEIGKIINGEGKVVMK